MDRGAWRAAVHGVAQNQTRLKRLSTHYCHQQQERLCCISRLSPHSLTWCECHGSHFCLQNVANKTDAWVETDKQARNGSLSDVCVCVRARVCVCVCVCVCALWLQSCLNLWNPMDCSPPGSSVHGMLQARIPKWVGVSSSRGCSRPRDRSCVSSASCIAGKFFITEPLGKPKMMCSYTILSFRVRQMLCVRVGEKPPDIRHKLLGGCWNVFTGLPNTGWPLAFFFFFPHV